jgi:regulator of sigma E protease
MEQALTAIFDELLADGIIELSVVEADGGRREVELDVRGRVNELTEPDALFDGLGIVLGPRVRADVGRIESLSAAENAGFRVGDRIVAIDATPLLNWTEVVRYISARPNQPLAVSVERNGRVVDVAVVPESVVTSDGETIGRIGIERADDPREDLAERLRIERRYGPIASIGQGVRETWDMTALTVRMIGRMLTGDVSLRNASGPIMIAVYAGDFAQAGFDSYLRFLCLISISLGIMNLLPVPILDGGQIVMSIVEGIKGSPLSMRAAIIGQQVGLAMLVLLMGFVFYNDITRLLGP